MMSKRLQETQGGEERYGGSASAQASMADQPTQATAAQMARRKIAQTRKASGSQRSSRANTPTANPFGQPQQQSMPSFQPPAQGGSGFGSGFNFSAGGDSNPFAQQSQTGTPPPAAFQFGAAPSQPSAQQNGGSGIFGNNTSSFGSTFGSNNAQQQPNGFNPSTSTTFGNQANPSSFVFGQGKQSQQNDATPSTNASFPTFDTQKENPFKNFGQSQQTQSTPSTSFGGFNSQPNGDQTQPQPNGTKSFFNAETPKTTTSNIFGNFGQQQNENKTPFASTAPSLQPAPTSSTSLFNGQAQDNAPNPPFGSTPRSEQANNPNGSVFLGLDSARASTVKPGMFTSSNETSKSSASNPFTFDQQKETSSGPPETPKAGSMFSNWNQSQSNGDKTSMFGGNAATDQTPKLTTNVFNFGQSQHNTSTSGFKFGQTPSQADDANMTTPGNTPQKPSLLPTSSSSGAHATDAPTTQGKGLFDRISNGAASTIPNSLFNPQVPTSTATPAQQTQTPAAQSGNLFDRISHDDVPATTIKQTSFTPSTNLIRKAPEAAAATPSAAPWLSHTPAAPQTTVTPPTPKRQITGSTIGTQQPAPGSKEAIFKRLNEGLLKHLQNEDAIKDWSTIMQYYLREASKIEQPTKANSSAVGSIQAQTVKIPPFQPSAGGSSSNMFGTTTPEASATVAANMFASSAAQQTPKPSSLFVHQPPATAPVNKKRPVPFEEEDGDAQDTPAPATEKRMKPNEAINYPSLPENASSTSRLFQAALDKSTSSPAAPASSGFVPPSSSGGFKPFSSTGLPSFGAPALATGGFLASFGKRANAEEEKQKKKRKAEDYDSDEETEEQWEAKDRAEQEAKRKKIEDAAKTGSGFSVSRSVTPVPPETPAANGKSLFERISKEPPATAPSKPTFTSQTPASGNGTSNLFGSKTPATTSSSNLSAAEATAKTGEAAAANSNGSEKAGEHEDGDNTWKPNTPIKFGGAAASAKSTTPAAAPPKFGNLFGEPKTTTTPGNNASMLNIPSSKPNLGFNFGGQPTSLSNSRATTPGVTTDGEGASTAGEEEEGPQADPQIEDQSALHPKEREEHTVLFEVAMAKASKIDEKRDAETGEVSKGWVEKGKGPLYILKNKQTEKVSVLMKIKPLGRAAMNFSVQAKMRFDVVGSSGKQIQGAFVDTLADKNANQMSRWMVAVGKAEVAQELAEVLNAVAGVV